MVRDLEDERASSFEDAREQVTKGTASLVAGGVGRWVGSYYGGMEARPFMVDALRQPR